MLSGILIEHRIVSSSDVVGVHMHCFLHSTMVHSHSHDCSNRIYILYCIGVVYLNTFFSVDSNSLCKPTVDP